MRVGGLRRDVEAFNVCADQLTILVMSFCGGDVGLGEGMWVRDCRQSKLMAFQVRLVPMVKSLLCRNGLCVGGGTRDHVINSVALFGEITNVARATA